MRSLEMLRRAHVGLIQRSRAELDGAGYHTVAQRRASVAPEVISLMPTIHLAPIQDLDPDSPTYGEFLFMAGYDELG